jgi:hypothetical protein
MFSLLNFLFFFFFLRQSMWNNVVNAWWPLIFYKATDAPKFYRGMWAMIGACIATLLVTGLVWYMERREWRIRGVGSMPGEDTGQLEEMEWNKSSGIRQVNDSDLMEKI